MSHRNMAHTVEELEALAASLRRRASEAQERADILREECLKVEEKIKHLKEKK